MIRFNFKRLILAIFVTFIFTNPSYSEETNQLIKVNWSFKQLTGNKSLLSFLIIYDFGFDEYNEIQITYYPNDYWNDVYNLSFERIPGWEKKMFNTITRILRADNFVITNKEMKQLDKIELCL